MVVVWKEGSPLFCKQGDRTALAIDESWDNHLGLVARKRTSQQSQLGARASSLLLFESVFVETTVLDAELK